MKQCNDCSAYRCSIINSKWPKNRDSHHIQPEVMASDCPNYLNPRPFAVPILMHLLAKDGTVVGDLLNKTHLALKEHHERPYFKLVKAG